MKTENRQKTKKTRAMRHRKFFLALLLLIIGGAKVWGQTNYVFYNGTYGYIHRDGSSVDVSSKFNPDCVWRANNTLGGTSRNIRSYTDDTKYMRGASSNITLGSSNNEWRGDDTYLQWRNNKTNYYVKYDGNNFDLSSTQNNGRRFTYYTVSKIESHEAIQTSPTVSGPEEGGHEFHDLGSKTYTHSNASETKGYTHYAFNNTNHYWYDGEDHTAAPTAGGSFTYRWGLSANMTGYATVDQNGVVSYTTAVPEYQRAAMLWCEAENNETHAILPIQYFDVTFQNPNYLLNPEIHFQNTSSGTIAVWFTYPGTAPSDLKFYYTTDGTQPTTGDHETTAETRFEVPDGTTISVMAAATGHHTSDVARVMVHVETGVYENIVVLHDHEDNNWSYYSDPDSPIKSLYPRNVTISYYGYGNNTMTTDDNDPGANNMTNVASTAVAVSRYETQNTFVYHKTLERDANNRFPYELIPNPFSKRPTYGSDADEKWRGFYGWRIKSIGSGKIYDATTGGSEYHVGDILTTEYQTLYFQPNDNAQTNANNATAMTVEFEAIWARAYRVADAASSTNTNMSSDILAADSYERNFVVVTSDNSSTNLSTGSKPCTVTMIEPDGSTDYRSSSVYINPQFIIAQNNWKFEWINIQNYGNNNNSSTISANGHNLVLGRGLMQSGASHDAGNGYGTPGTNLCAAYVNGIGKNASNGSSTYATALDYILRIESGFYTEIAYVSAKKGSYGEASSTIHVKGFFGNDYDRALNNNERLISNGQTGNPAVCMGAEDGACISSSNHSNYNRETFNLNVKSGLIGSGTPEGWEPGNNGLYLGKALGSGASGARTCGNRRLLFEGGKIISISGGMDRTPGNSTAQADNNVETLIMRFKGTAEVLTSAYGGAATQPTYGHRILIYTGGFVHGWTATGCNGISKELGQNYGTGYMYVGGNTRIGDGTLGNINGTGRGIVMGAGNGRSDSPTTGEMSYGSHVVIADNADIENNVYGGGNYGYTLKTADVHILGGTVHGRVYGGSNQKQGNDVNIVMKKGVVGGGIFGGSNITGTISGNVNIQVLGGRVGDLDHPASNENPNGVLMNGLSACVVFGGGYGENTEVSGDVDITIGNSVGGPLLYGSVFGGGAMGKVNTDTDNHTYVTVNNGTFAGYVYGGGLGLEGKAADVNGNVVVNFHGGTTRYVFGANCLNGAPKGTVTINMDGGTVYEMFGGGDQAKYVAPAENKSYPQINISGGKIGRFDFQNYLHGNVFGGGNLAEVDGSPEVNITGANTQIEHSVYGGGNKGNVTGDATVHVTDAKVGTSAIHPEEKGSVYGAGLGASTQVGGNTSVTVDGKANVAGNVYGGGEAGDVVGTTAVVIGDDDNSTTTVNDVFGAGKGAESDVRSTDGTHVTIKKSASVKGSVYGGAEEGTVRGEVTEYSHNVTNVTIENGLVAGNVYGGGKMGIVNGRTIVNMKGGTIEGNLFGGALGSQGSVFVRGLKTINMTNGLVVGDIYGGSQNADDANEYYVEDGEGGEDGEKDEIAETEADKHSSIFVNISGGQVGENVYGGGFYGNIHGNVTVNIGADAIAYGTDNAKNINKLSDTPKVMTKLEGSIYAGSDWGTITEGGTFGPNNITGYSNIYIDGGGYDMNATLQNNYMNISGSIYGAGTSSDAGSKGRRIFIRNYGLDHAVEVEDIQNPGNYMWTYSTCSRKLYTIQRADSVFLENSHITFRGQGDMASPSTTQHYSMYNIFRVLRLVNNSTVDCEYPVANLYSLNSMALLGENKTIFNASIGKEDATTKTGDYTVVMYDRYAHSAEFYEATEQQYENPKFNYDITSQLADQVCLDGEDQAAIDNKIRVDNGVYFVVGYPRAWNKALTANQYQYGDEANDNVTTLYGELRGFFHIVYPQNCGFLYSRPRITTAEQPEDLIYNNNRHFTGYWQKENIYDGGTSSYRYARAFDPDGGNVTLLDHPHYNEQAYMLQGPYINHLPNTASGTATGPAPTPGSTVVCDRNYYRVWEIKGAGGDSQVEAVLVAKTDGTNDDKIFTTTTTVRLSPINQGSYVKIRHGGTDAPWGNWGDDVNMVNAGVISQYAGSPEENYAYFVETLDPDIHGWHGPVGSGVEGVSSELEKIKTLPNTTFGLSIKPLERLSKTQTNNGGTWTTTGDMLVSVGSVSDDNYLPNTRLYAGGEGATMLQLCLTYSNKLDRNTVLSPMTIFFDEYTSDGTLLYTTEVRITITTQTTIDQDFDEPLYALEFGKGEVHDKFSVKATLPIFAMIPGSTESALKVKSIGAPVFNSALTGGTPQLVSVSNFNAMSASAIQENVVALKFGPSLTYDNTQGWLSGYSYDDPEASLVDITDASLIGKTLGTADGRKNIGLQFDLYYNGSVHFQGVNDVEICHFPLTLSVSNLAGSDPGVDDELKIMVIIYKRGKGTDWYIDGVNGRNSNKGHNPDAPKLTLNGVLADEYKPGDNIFIVNQVTINSVNTTIWPDEKGGSEGVTLYRYPGGHTLQDGTVDPDGCYTGPLVVAKSDLRFYGITLNGLDTIANNGHEYYVINNTTYTKPNGFAMNPTSPLVVVEDGGTLALNRSLLIYNANTGSEDKGGAVWVKKDGTLDINGQSFITNNRTTTSEGAGVYVDSGATVNVMDDVYVAGNTKGSVRSNVYLPDVASVINIDKENGLSPISLIGVTKDAFPAGMSFTPIAFSSVQNNSEDAFNQGFFFDDQSIYAVYYDPYDANLSGNDIYFAKTWVTEVTEKPGDWDITAIDDPEDLAWLISYVNGYNGSAPHPGAVATVTADLDMNRCIWVPIGDATNNFKGVFDGGGYDITGLHCSMTGISSQGLFGYVDNGTVKNTFVLGGTLTAKDRDRVYMGSIAGVVRNGGKVYASEGALNLNTVAETTIMGGLVGLLDHSTLHSSISVANLNGYQMGGLVGETTEGSVLLNCYAFSKFNDAKVENESGVIIPNTHYVAGMVADNDITIENCYVRLRKQNNVASINAFDAHNQGDGLIKKCYTYEGDATAYANVAASPESVGSTALYEDATHPYTYGENYNHTVRNAKIGPEMLKVLNMNVDTLCNIATYPGYNSSYKDEMVRWTRTTSDINSDFPVLKMPAGVAVSTNLTDSILYYHHTLNEALTRYSGENAIVDAYANSETAVSVAQTENVKLYINEDVAVLQEVDLNAYVGITLDNSAGANGANPSTGELDDVDWHMFSSSLQNAPLGLNYTDNEKHDWWSQSYVSYYSFYPDDDAKSGYFPGNTPTLQGKNNFDFYCFYEPQYHWINFKRNGNSHWHQDGSNEWLGYQYTDNDGVHHNSSEDNNEPELIRGKGYMLAVEQETYLQAYGKLNNGDVTYRDVTNTTASKIAGANLLGNPYQSYLDFKKFAEANAGEGKIWSAADKAFYVILDEDRKGYVNYHYDASWNEYAANRFIHMHQGFFVATAQSSTTAVFTNDMRNAKGFNTTFRDEEMPRYPLVNLILEEGSGNKDYAVVELSRPKAGGAIKQKHLKAGKAQIYTHYNNEDYSIAFTEVGVTSVPVRFKTDERNAFTLTWNTQNGDFSYLHLIDNLTGVDIDCLENDEYVFGADPSDFESRFKLVFQYTGVEENEFEVNGNFAFFNNDELIVNGEGRLECIDLQGRVLYVTDLYGPQSHVSLPEFSSGLYLLRFRNNKQVMVQKIIIK